MEEHLLQAVGKIAGIGGLSLGVFLLLFREVIRKNIFPTLSDDHAYSVIRQFMYLTFAIAVCGIAAWTYVSAASAAVRNGKVSDTERPPVQTVNIAGTWYASVKYSWGDTHPEVFEFEVNGRALSGSGSYVTVKRGILNGTIDGNHISFETTSDTGFGEQRHQEKHRYRGTASDNAIEFVLDSDSASSSPVKFTAHRDAPK